MNVVKVVFFVLSLLIIQLQYRLWLGDGGREQVQLYQQQLDSLSLQVKEKQERNQALYGEVLDLRKGQEALEERARYELGMIKQDETFFQIIE